ncbi:hypothetical protein G7Y79_00013g035240 [Physcia stellaris]|nr:hypothetical protein G7Y79_00013g035240 [Physcia stellaris]
MATRLALYDGYHVRQTHFHHKKITSINVYVLRIPVWIINATYMGPVTLYLYFRYGRPSPPSSEAKGPSCHQANGAEKASGEPSPAEQNYHDRHEQPTELPNTDTEPHSQPRCCEHESSPSTNSTSEPPRPPSSRPSEDTEKQPPDTDGMSHCHTSPSPRPFWATVLIGVSHCGAGCVLGDLVGEWLVYGTGASIASRSIWPELLIDYAFALLFGIVFQYFSIAPMSSEYGIKTVWRAAKADVLSLTSFEVGAFGWMVAYQVGIWGYRMSMTTWVYWWMMQVGMALGFATAAPVNWWLIRKGVKEPCC